jgi:hypothetical protein
MRIESPLVSQSLIESPQVVEKKEINANNLHDPEPSDDSPSFMPSPFGSSGTYSVSSLRAAVDYHAKFLTVARNNLEAANHPAVIPKTILDRLSG